MLHDIMTIFWKEMTSLRRIYRKLSSYLSTAMYVMFFGIFPAYFLKEDFLTSPLTLFFLSLATLSIGAGMATLAFAGERENHTMETLLASRLSDSAILLGKMLSYTVYAWGYVPLCIVAGWMTVMLITHTPQSYDPKILLGGNLVGLLVAWFSTNVGILASLRSATVKEAGRKIKGIYLLFMLPYFGLNFMPETNRMDLLSALSQVNLWLILIGVMSILIVLNSTCFYIANQQFKRKQMILD